MAKARSFLVPFKYNEKVAYVLEFSPLLLRFYANGALVSALSGEEQNTPSPAVVDEIEDDTVEIGMATSMVYQDDVRIILDDGVSIIDSVSNNVYSIVTPYGYDDLWDEDELCFKLQTIQHSDVLYIFSENHPIMVLKRFGEQNWSLSALELNNGPFAAMNSTSNQLTASAASGTITLTADQNVFSSTDVGRLIRLRGYGDVEKVWVTGAAVQSGDIYVSDNKYYQAQNSGTCGLRKPVHDEGIRSDGGVRWLYLHDGSGIVKISNYTNAKEVSALVLKRLPDAVCDGTVYWEMGLLHDGAKYPRSGDFFRNRFAFLVNTDEGPKVCLSVAGDYNNFSDMEYGETTAQSAITVPVLNTEFNDGKWLFSHDVLFVGTGSAEFFIDVVSASLPLSNDNVKIEQISNVGSKAIKPVAVGGHIFFADRFGLSLRDLSYNYYNDGYDQIDVSLLGKHLFRARIVAMSYQEVPDKILWCVTGDGHATALTFSAEQEVAALSWHEFSGEVESLAVIPNFNDCRDEVWIEVKRFIHDNVMRTVEYMENGMPLALPKNIYATTNVCDKEAAEADYVLQQARYLDGAVLFVRAHDDNATVVSGLNHLEGQRVLVFADGGVSEPQLVTNGCVDIKPTDVMVLVGKEIVSQYMPQTIYLDDSNGSGIGKPQRVNHVLLMLYQSGGGEIGEDENHMSSLLYRDADAMMNAPQPLFSGNKEVVFHGLTDERRLGAKILIQNKSPLPMNILAIVPSMD